MTLCDYALTRSSWTRPSTLSGAVGTSIVMTMWENKSTYMHAELSGLVDQSGDVTRLLTNAGASHDVVLNALDHIAYGQSVML